MSDEIAKCELCGEPMPPGEQMFKFHGYSGPCPKETLQKNSNRDKALDALLVSTARGQLLTTKTDGELAALFIEKVWGQLPLTSEQSDIADELHVRFVSVTAERDELAAALRLAINTVECASIDIRTGEELPWYKKAKKALKGKL